MKNIVGDIQTEVEGLGHKFVYGPMQFLNYFSSTQDISSMEYIFCLFPVIMRGEMNGQSGLITGWNCEMSILFGRKYDEDSETASQDEFSSLDETYQQKYERRLQTLASGIQEVIEGFVCDSNYLLKSVKLSDRINQTDENIDFVQADLVVYFDEDGIEPEEEGGGD